MSVSSRMNPANAEADTPAGGAVRHWLGVYVNFLTQEEQDRVQAAYGDNYGRLVAVKNKCDPTKLFSVDQNIRPNV